MSYLTQLSQQSQYISSIALTTISNTKNNDSLELKKIGIFRERTRNRINAAQQYYYTGTSLMKTPL